jgi:hypothetical protein
MKYVNGIFMGVVLFCIATSAMAGDLDSPAGPTSADSAMYTMEDVYNRINEGTAGTKRSGSFTEPSAGPASTGHDLDDLYDLASERSRPAKTGQTTSYATGDDGGLEKGVSWPSPRFTDNSNGTVTDNLTGLIWLKDANCSGARGWTNALSYCNSLAHGSCSLTDESSAGDWRLPHCKELVSLLDLAYNSPALADTAGTSKWSSGDAFTNVQLNYYWSSTTYAGDTDYAWFIRLTDGDVHYGDKDTSYYVWPVRGGQ